MRGTRLNRPCEAQLFPSQVIENCTAALFQFGIEVSVFRDDRFCNLRKEGIMQADLRAEASCAADDHTRDVVAPRVTRDNAIRDQEGSLTDMVSDDTVRCEICIHLLTALACQ